MSTREDIERCSGSSSNGCLKVVTPLSTLLLGVYQMSANDPRRIHACFLPCQLVGRTRFTEHPGCFIPHLRAEIRIANRVVYREEGTPWDIIEAHINQPFPNDTPSGVPSVVELETL